MEKTITRSSPVVLLDMKKSYRIPFLIEEARKRDWRFFNLDPTIRYIPKGFRIIGAITDAIPDNQFAKKLRKLGCPVIRMGKLPHPQDHLQPVVLPDLFAAGVMAAEHYASKGFTQLGFMGHTPWGDAEALFGGFLKRSKELGLKMNLGRKVPLNIPEKYKKPDKRRIFVRDFRNKETKEWLSALPKPVGILASNDNMASNMDLLCNSLGISVPGEVSILCYNDVPECSMSYTPLSAIDIGMEKIAKQTIQLLDDLINDNPPKGPRIFVAPSGIILRQSTDILAVPDRAVARALTFIWENISEPISVEDVAKASGIHLRTLNRSFRKCLNRTITEEMLRKRLEKSCDLLRNSTMTVFEIIETVGFSSNSYFHKRFREAFGMTPNAFRTKKQKN